MNDRRNSPDISILALQLSSIAGFESPVCWQHPQRGLIAPGRFIPVAEAVGLTSPLEKWMLRQACQRSRLSDRPHSVNVNLSAE